MAFVVATLLGLAPRPRFARAPTPRAALPSTELTELDPWLLERGGASAVACGEHDGVRGLVATRDAATGDVLLEVPVSACLLSAGDGDSGLPGEPPSWAATLPWNVQLALSVLRHEADAASEFAPFLRSWPEEAPPLPSGLDAEQLAEAQDRAFETEADTAYFWAGEQYVAAYEAAEAAAAADGAAFSFYPQERFTRALYFVWSRCLRLSAGPALGVRRLLVPVLDLANHDGAEPSALYAYSGAGRTGDCIRLHAARPLRAGDAVTITYGEHTSSHFALYYGFVPRVNPHDYLSFSLAALLAAAPDDAAPDDGWIAALTAADASGLPTTALQLRAAAPDEAADLALRAALQPDEAVYLANTLAAIEADELDEDDLIELDTDEAAAERAALLAGICAGLEAAELSTVEEDEAALAAAALPPAVRLCVEVRLARKRLLRELQASMREIAAAPDDACSKLAFRQRAPSTYPALDAIPASELAGWAELRWDASSALPGVKLRGVE